MKYLLVLVLLAVVFWLWRHQRQANQRAAARKAQPQQLSTVSVVACAVCQVHLPRSEALVGPRGNYCCDAHRQQHGS